ncbi:CocE/NonD family hydrolase [Roseateles sp.]|uniref:CocE/NonD family hydrolase n=1 Tax=Roseateles sp. TaxID=1971397 RepID=UPI0039647D50
MRCSLLLSSMLGCLLAPAGAVAAEPEPFDIQAHYTKAEYRVPVRDGKRLFTVVHAPKDLSKTYPVLMIRTPYGCGPYGVDTPGGLHSPSDEFLKSGYVFVCQDVRGRYMSEGEWVEMRPQVPVKRSNADVDESSDAYDSIEWMLKHLPGHNGRFGVWGVSYPGFYAAAALIDGHPALKAGSPQAPINDIWDGDDSYRGGAFMLAQNFGFYTGFKVQPNPTRGEHDGPPFTWTAGDDYNFYLRLGPLGAIAALQKDNRYLQELMAPDRYDAAWQARALAPHMKNVKAAVMMVGGWFDAEDLAGPLKLHRAIARFNPKLPVNQLVMGPWVHGGWLGRPGKSLGAIDFGSRTAETFRVQLHAFFEQHLRDGPAQPPAAAVTFETGTNVWRRQAAWPPASHSDRTLYLRAGGRLGFEPPVAGEAASTSYVSDPARPVPYVGQPTRGVRPDYMVADQRFAATRPDVLVFEGPALERDLSVAGPLRVRLVMASTGTDADFVVKLIDVHPHDRDDTVPGAAPRAEGSDPGLARTTLRGFQQLVRAWPLRARFRNGLDKPEPLVPGQPVTLEFELPDIHHAFRRGHQLMVQVQSSWFPLMDRNPQRFVKLMEAKLEDFQPATQTVFHTPGQASSISLKAAESP